MGAFPPLLPKSNIVPSLLKNILLLRKNILKPIDPNKTIKGIEIRKVWERNLWCIWFKVFEMYRTETAYTGLEVLPLIADNWLYM